MLHRLLILSLGLVLTGCDTSHNEHSTQPVANHPPLTTLSPANSMAYGRESALHHHLAKIWLISKINKTPITQTYYLDFTELLEGEATLQTTGCPDITMSFDTSSLKDGILMVTEIDRDISQCSNHIEDTLTQALSDIRYFERQEGTDDITLISYQDTLTLTPFIPEP